MRDFKIVDTKTGIVYDVYSVDNLEELFLIFDFMKKQWFWIDMRDTVPHVEGSN